MTILNLASSAFVGQLAEQCVWVLAHFLWQGLLLALAGAVLAACARSPRARSAMHLATLVAMLVAPAVTWCSLQPTPLAMAPAPHAVGIASDGSVLSSLPAVSPAFTAHTPSLWQTCWPWVAASYLLGVSILALRFAAGVLGVERLKRRAMVVTEPALLAALARQMHALGMRTKPLLAYSRDVAAPALVGLFKPMILLPVAMAEQMPVEQLELLLAHELAHLRRLDPLAVVVQRLAETLLFFHPAVWWVSQQLSQEREYCCDDLVLAGGASPEIYADALVRTAELTLGLTRPGALVLSAAGESSQFGGRVRRVLEAWPERRGFRLAGCGGWPGLVLSLVVLTVGTATLVAQQPAGREDAKAEAKSEAAAVPARLEVSQAPRADAVLDLNVRYEIAGDVRRRAVNFGTSVVVAFGETTTIGGDDRLKTRVVVRPTEQPNLFLVETQVLVAEAGAQEVTISAPKLTLVNDRQGSIEISGNPLSIKIEAKVKGLAPATAKSQHSLQEYARAVEAVAKRQRGEGDAAAALQTRSMNNVRLLLLSMHEYVAVHKEWPEKLADLKSDFPGYADLLANPRNGLNPGYVYQKPKDLPADGKGLEKIAVMWELKQNQPDPRGVIGYADGHVAVEPDPRAEKLAHWIEVPGQPTATIVADAPVTAVALPEDCPATVVAARLPELAKALSCARCHANTPPPPATPRTISVAPAASPARAGEATIDSTAPAIAVASVPATATIARSQPLEAAQLEAAREECALLTELVASYARERKRLELQVQSGTVGVEEVERCERQYLEAKLRFNKAMSVLRAIEGSSPRRGGG